jgi:predicted Zn-ribbon and HTH transcriptional regulator
VSWLKRLFGGSHERGGSSKDVASALQAIEDSTAQRALPTLVCRTCGLKYENTGTYLQGSRCPACVPNGGARSRARRALREVALDELRIR